MKTAHCVICGTARPAVADPFGQIAAIGKALKGRRPGNHPAASSRG